MRNIRSPLSGFLSPLFASTAFSSGGGVSPPLPETRIAEITRMTGDRDPVVPQTYHQRVAADAFNPRFHPVGDPLLPSCAIFTHKAVKDGRWSDPTVWDTGTVPGANAAVCSGAYNLIYDVLSDVLIKDIHINGAGSFTVDPAVRTRLWVDTFSCDGRFILGESVDNPIPDSGIVEGGKRVPQFEMVFWQSEAPLQTARLGLNTMGPVRIHGARKDSHLEVDGSVLAGATSCTLRGNAGQAGWKVGDEVMFVGTEWSGTSSTDAQYVGPTSIWAPNNDANGTRTNTHGFKNNQTEVRTITAVSGTTISWSSPLSFNHLVETDTLPRGQTVTLYPIVSCLTGSIRFRTADASDTAWVGDLANLQKRAHAMFMFDDDIQIRGAEFKNMGRTASDPSLNGPDEITRYATSDTSQPITNVNNTHGRYALHIHRTGAHFGRKMVVVERCSVWAPTDAPPMPGWAIVHHDSRAAIDHCNVYNFRGAGIVSELGNEIGQWIGNVVAWGRGDGFFIDWGSRAERWHNHNGHTGVGFESQARQILQQDNYASGCRQGWLFMQQNVNMLARIPDGDSLRYRDPLTQGGRDATGGYDFDRDTYGIEQANVPDFLRNHAWDCSDAFFKSHQQHTDRTDPIPFLIKECHWVNCFRAYHLVNYTFHYYVYDSLWTGSPGQGTASTLGSVMWSNSFINIKIRDFNNGFVDTGYSIAYQGHWLEVQFENVPNPYVGSSELNFGTDPTTRLAWNVMGNALVTGATTGRPRLWADSPITDESLPSPYPAAPFGPNSTERSENLCPALGEAPYVVLYPGGDTTLTPTGTGQFSFKALIVDSLGYRWHGDHQSPETTLTIMTPKQTRPGSDPAFATGTDIVRRNGVFLDGGIWKSRAWFIDIDRATGDHFTWYVDLTCSGFDAGFLAANTVNPASTKPVVPLLPETTRTGSIVEPALHTVTSASSVAVFENAQLAHELTASVGTVRWSITGGADAAQFEVAYTGGRWVLRWVGNGTQDFEAPADAGANNAYDVQVTATDLLGRPVNQAVTVTVTDVIEAVTEFSDDFTGAAGQWIDDRPGYEFFTGTPGKFFLNTTGTAVNTTNASGLTAYRLPDIGRSTDWQIRFRSNTASSSGVRCGLLPSGNARRLEIDKFNDNSTVRVRYVNDSGSTVSTWIYPNPLGDLIKLELLGTTFRVYRNGVEQTPTSGPTVQAIPEALPTGSRFYLVNTLNQARTNTLDDLYIGPA